MGQVLSTAREQGHQEAAWTEGPEEVSLLRVGLGTVDYSYSSVANKCLWNGYLKLKLVTYLGPLLGVWIPSKSSWSLVLRKILCR